MSKSYLFLKSGCTVPEETVENMVYELKCVRVMSRRLGYAVLCLSSKSLCNFASSHLVKIFIRLRNFMQIRLQPTGSPHLKLQQLT